MITYSQIVELAEQNFEPQTDKIFKTEDEWRTILPREVFEVTRLAATERPGTSELCQKFDPGKYSCACCGNDLFNSENKFESGTGWPSFSQPVSDKSVIYKLDESFGMQRIEVLCARCDSHLGHVFPDGTRKPSNLRFCINGLALIKS